VTVRFDHAVESGDRVFDRDGAGRTVHVGHLEVRRRPTHGSPGVVRPAVGVVGVHRTMLLVDDLLIALLLSGSLLPDFATIRGVN
jgi:hypothetical protein